MYQKKNNAIYSDNNTFVTLLFNAYESCDNRHSGVTD